MADIVHKRNRLSRNKKKGWRKTDITHVEEYLDDKRHEERTGYLQIPIMRAKHCK